MSDIRLEVISAFRFNRYMVECEFEVKKGDTLWGIGFNRYMVECEFFCDSARFCRL